jgi:sialate O-acetylesterase
MIAPFVNMTVKGFLWYQGENNCGNPDGMGNSANRSGYGCQLPALVAEWRRLWSAAPGTTDALAPFGVVTLAAGGSEGNDESMAGMRWSQTANYGALPNAAMPNTFLAHAYDLGDPMDNLGAPCVNQSDGAVNASAFDPGVGGPCVWPPVSKWNAAVRPLRDVVFKNGAPSFMGGIHPRFKREVGRRLALAFLGATSPTIAGCEVSSSAARIELRLSVDGSDPVALQWAAEDYNQSTWGGNGDSSTLMVCAGAASAAACLNGSGAMANWFAAPLALSGAAVGSVQKLSVDLGALHGKQPQAIRYGWPLSRGADTCCPAKAVRSGLEPCVPGSCPIITATHALPANPFYATISAAGKCECMAPQVCDA